MVRQGDILKLDFDPQAGYEQAGYRPAVVVSNDFFNAKTGMAIVCPIANAAKPYPLRITLDGRTSTTGVILCDHIKALDVNACGYKVVERLPDDLLDEIIAVIYSEIERSESF